MNAAVLRELAEEGERTAFLERVRAVVEPVNPEDFRRIAELTLLLGELQRGPARLRHLLFGPKTERTGRVCPDPGAPSTLKCRRKRKGHGRNGAKDFTGATWTDVPHDNLRAGCSCPGCRRGALRPMREPATALRLEGAPPITAQGFRLERLRCEACGKVYTASAPPEAGVEKYAPSVGVTIAFLRYGAGLPHYRLARLQHNLGVPLPESTQWELLEPVAEAATPVFAAMISLAANAGVLHHDDTRMRILDLRRAGNASAREIDPQRKGTFTTNLLGESDGHPLALFFTGWRHAGENLAQVLRQRAEGLEPPIQMCDALASNCCHEHTTKLAFCVAHMRREFVAAAPNFPEECRHVLETVGEVYRFEREAKDLGLGPKARLEYHQARSRPVLDPLKAWMQDKLDQKHVEPNSGLGQAIGYALRHWEPLTLFLREPGAPLDNNPSERALKLAILHRKNSLSYKTVGGARTGDLFMSLIHTCRLNRQNPFAYLLALATHAEAVRECPADWLPWNYPQGDNPAPGHDPPKSAAPAQSRAADACRSMR